MNEKLTKTEDDRTEKFRDNLVAEMASALKK